MNFILQELDKLDKRIDAIKRKRDSPQETTNDGRNCNYTNVANTPIRIQTHKNNNPTTSLGHIGPQSKMKDQDDTPLKCDKTLPLSHEAQLTTSIGLTSVQVNHSPMANGGTPIDSEQIQVYSSVENVPNHIVKPSISFTSDNEDPIMTITPKVNN